MLSCTAASRTNTAVTAALTIVTIRSGTRDLLNKSASTDWAESHRLLIKLPRGINGPISGKNYFECGNRQLLTFPRLLRNGIGF